MRFDATQPYAEVLGIPGVAFEQNGRRFNPGGAEVEIVYHGDDSEVRRVEGAADADDEPAEPPNPTDLAGMHWKHLKALVEQFNGEWTNKEDAIRFLKGAA